MDMKLEVVVLPVSDVDRAKAFYESLGWRLDADFVTGLPGPDPKRADYGSWASFDDPDGNGWVIQEIRTRLPGR
jgi:catechol 2,3-dioxygenase-like lactoylglutathione lyase family enzyme